MAEKTKTCSLSMRRETRELLDKYAAGHKHKSRSSLICDLLEFAIEKKGQSSNQEIPLPDEKVISQKVGNIWYSSLYVNQIPEMPYCGETWLKVDVDGVLGENEADEVGNLEIELKTKCSHLFNNDYGESKNTSKKNGENATGIKSWYVVKESEKATLLAKNVDKTESNKNIKILAVRLNTTELHRYGGDSRYSASYAVTLIDISKNIDSKDHFYLDYHSIETIPITEFGSGSLPGLIKGKKTHIPLNYIYWLPITIFAGNVFILGVKRRAHAKDDIERLKTGKIIIARSQKIKPYKAQSENSPEKQC
ncbi:hypothetical protein K1940_001794 [Salmonella enterica subsp. enterica serovar Larochelle]|nr:hypothetical protein [Salmonella enterica subsp. enterica serovar Larochelle]